MRRWSTIFAVIARRWLLGADPCERAVYSLTGRSQLGGGGSGVLIAKLDLVLPVQSHNVYREGKVHVCRQMCPTCIFRPGNLMRLGSGRVRQMVDDAKANEACIVCHSTLQTGRNACCRGFFDRYPTQPLQIAERLNMIVFTD